MLSDAGSIFLDFQLPSPTTWFYWSLILAVSLFFQFTRAWSLRNLDLISLYLFAPGLLVVQATGTNRIVGYAALLAAAMLWFVRCVLDNAMVQRSSYRTNLNPSGLTWFSLALLIVLIGVTIRKPIVPDEPIGKTSAAITVVKEQAAAAVKQTAPPGDETAIRIAVERGLALCAHLAVCTGLYAIGRLHFRDAELGTAMAALYLLLPYTGYHVSQLHLVLPAALTTWALVCCQSPLRSGLLLGLASGTSFFPLLLLPIWLRWHWRRRIVIFLLAYAAALAIGFGVAFAVLTPEGIARSLHLADWQAWKQPTTESIWQGVHWAYRIPVFILFCGYLGMLCFWPRLSNMANLAALSASIFIGLQFWYADRGGLYVLWFLPLLIVITMRPTLPDAELPGSP